MATGKGSPETRLERPEVKALIAVAVARSRAPFRKAGKPTLVIRSVSPTQRPRRKPAARKARS
jgi:hypothetical protein